MDKIRVALVNTGLKAFSASHITPPLGIMYIAAFLRQQLPVTLLLINQKAEKLSNGEVARRISDFDADIAGFTVLSVSSHLMDDISEKLRRLKKEILIVAGGPHISALREKALENNCIDIGVPGEGEQVFEEVVRAWKSGGGFEGISGIIRRNSSGAIMTNPGEIKKTKELDSLPFPAWDLIDLSAYWKSQSMLPVPRRKYLSLFSSRGCPYHCIYCHRIFGNKFRNHSAARIVAEIDYLGKKYGVNDFEFLDDIFNLDHKRVFDFCAEMKQKDKPFKFAFPNGIRGDILTIDEIDALKEAGLYFCSFALESGSEKIQKSIGKNLDIPRLLKNITYAASRKIFTNGFVMLGFPGETRKDMEKTIKTAANSSLHTASVFTVMPFPGTAVYNQVMQKNPEKLAKLNFNCLTYTQGRINLSAVEDTTLMALQRRANTAFFLKPSRLLRIVTEHPQPYLLPLYIPEFFKRIFKQ